MAMPKFTPLDRAAALTSLRSKTCPGCGQRKAARHSLCLACWGGLPQRQQHDLYLSFAGGYLPALNTALKTLADLGIRADDQPGLTTGDER